jgi:hypothetical protein
MRRGPAAQRRKQQQPPHSHTSTQTHTHTPAPRRPHRYRPPAAAAWDPAWTVCVCRGVKRGKVRRVCPASETPHHRPHDAHTRPERSSRQPASNTAQHSTPAHLIPAAWAAALAANQVAQQRAAPGQRRQALAAQHAGSDGALLGYAARGGDDRTRLFPTVGRGGREDREGWRERWGKLQQ